MHLPPLLTQVVDENTFSLLNSGLVPLTLYGGNRR